ncbi:MAG TPA: efflux transporter outer membrane subunit [Methylophilaceae bacterium]|jgi:NodT family efflux transporter outer membrane factor (OMF) lipoprotein
MNIASKLSRANLSTGHALSMTMLLSTLISGCSIFPEYKTAEVKTPAAWHAPLPHTGKPEALMDWWKQFNDPVLDTLLGAAEQDNPSLDIAVANIKVARAATVVARADALPSVSANASKSRSKSNSAFGSTVVSSISDSSKASLDASWEIDLFGAIKFSRQAAQARLEAKQSDWHDARVSLAAEVANDYLDYRTCQLLTNAYQQQLDSKNETSRLTNIKAKAGFAAPADAALAEASAKSTESSLVAQKAQCDLTIKSLVALTGIEESQLTATLLNGAVKLPAPKEFVVNTIPANIVRQRPDLVSSERAIAAASADIGNAEANRYPNLSLSGSIGVADTSIGNISSSGSTWSFGPALSLPIFNAGKLKAQVNSAEGKYQLAIATHQQNVRNAIKEVEQSLVNLDSASQRAQLEQVSTEQYRKYFLATEINWKAGGETLLNLEDARRQAINAEVTMYNQQHDRVKYWITLYKAIGGGWQNTDSQNSNMKDLDNPEKMGTR